MNQRWRDRIDSYRSPAEVIVPREYEVAALEEMPAKAFVLQHHYSASYPAARFRFGLHRHGALVGVAVLSHPCSQRVLTNVFEGPAIASVELGRFVLLDEVPGNGETWFLARVFEHLRAAGLQGVVSFSDPVPRQCASGRTMFAGHVGTIYQAHNAVYLGRGTPRSLRILPDGRVLNDRGIQKIRAGERGWAASAARLQEFGAAAPGEDRRAWLATWLPRITRPLRHQGNHKYAWGLNRRTRRTLCGRPYPKPTIITGRAT